jgi:hypothetical protein
LVPSGSALVLARSSFSVRLSSRWNGWSNSRCHRNDVDVTAYQARRNRVGGRVVNKLARILTVILIAFALSSFLVYRLRLGSTLRATRQSNAAPNLVEETKTVEGQIQTVDPGTRTLTVVNDYEEVMLAFDERTAILESGHPIQPTAITSGTPATVKYTQRGAKKWARRIELAPAEPADASDSY